MPYLKPEFLQISCLQVVVQTHHDQYFVGDDRFEQRDRLIETLSKPRPGTLGHPEYGELSVCVNREVEVSTTCSEGRTVRFVEMGGVSYPTVDAATANRLMPSCFARVPGAEVGNDGRVDKLTRSPHGCV